MESYHFPPSTKALGFEVLRWNVLSLFQQTLLPYIVQLSKRNAESIEQLVLYRRLDFAPAADLEAFFLG